MTNLPSNNNRADKTLKYISWFCGLLIVSFFLLLFFDILRHGFERLTFNFIISDPTNAGRSGGIAPMLVSTLSLLILCLCIALPISIAAPFILRNTPTKMKFSLASFVTV